MQSSSSDQRLPDISDRFFQAWICRAGSHRIADMPRLHSGRIQSAGRHGRRAIAQGGVHCIWEIIHEFDAVGAVEAGAALMLAWYLEW